MTATISAQYDEAVPDMAFWEKSVGIIKIPDFVRERLKSGDWVQWTGGNGNERWFINDVEAKRS